MAQEVERSSSNWKIGGSIPGSSSPHVHMLMCPWARHFVNVNEWLDSPDEQVAYLCGNPCHQCMNVCERVNDM